MPKHSGVTRYAMENLVSGRLPGYREFWPIAMSHLPCPSFEQTLRQEASGVTLRHEPDWNQRRLFHRLDIDDRDVVGHGVRDICRFAVRRERDPGCTLPAKLGTSQ